MKINYLIWRPLLILALVAVCGGAFAQSTQAYNTEPNRFWIDLNAGIGGTTSYDGSTIPFAYGGFHDMEQIGVTDEWKRCHIQFLGMRYKTKYLDVNGSNSAYSSKLEFLYSCLNPSVRRWHFWTGASSNYDFELKQLEDLQNAAVTISLFHELSAEERVECDFAYDKADATHPWLTAFFQLSLPLYAVGTRPGFAYVVDPLNNLFDMLFGSSDLLFKMFPGCTTDLGLNLNLRNGNRIGLSYTWDYFSTGKKGAYRYDNAYHTVKLSFMFKIH
jgi:hypothetical protein